MTCGVWSESFVCNSSTHCHCLLSLWRAMVPSSFSYHSTLPGLHSGFSPSPALPPHHLFNYTSTSHIHEQMSFLAALPFNHFWLFFCILTYLLAHNYLNLDFEAESVGRNDFCGGRSRWPACCRFACLWHVVVSDFMILFFSLALGVCESEMIPNYWIKSLLN